MHQSGVEKDISQKAFLRARPGRPVRPFYNVAGFMGLIHTIFCLDRLLADEYYTVRFRREEL